MSDVLEISDLTVNRGRKQVVSNVSMRIAAGATTAVLGPNGAGKSSLVLALAGVLPTVSGSFSIGGRNLSGLPPHAIRAAGVGAVPEGHQVLTALTVEENLRAAGCILDRAAVEDAVDQVYEVFPELKELRDQAAGTLSGGQQQMVALGQALVSRPKFVLADEMSLGLAPLVVKRLMNVVRKLAEDGVGIMLIEQFTHVALGLASYVYVVNRGRVHFEGTPRDIEANPGVLQEAYLAGKF